MFLPPPSPFSRRLLRLFYPIIHLHVTSNLNLNLNSPFSRRPPQTPLAPSSPPPSPPRPEASPPPPLTSHSARYPLPAQQCLLAVHPPCLVRVPTHPLSFPLSPRLPQESILVSILLSSLTKFGNLQYAKFVTGATFPFSVKEIRRDQVVQARSTLQGKPMVHGSGTAKREMTKGSKRGRSEEMGEGG